MSEIPVAPRPAGTGGRPPPTTRARALAPRAALGIAAALGVMALSLAACGSSRVSLTGEVRYGKTAEEDYQAGEEELKDKNFAEATKFFEHVRNKYPFSRYAALAELRLADTKLAQGKYAEAAEAYLQFVKLHPSHDQDDYAAFRAGLAHFRDAPTDFFLFPPTYEKDQTQVRDAAKALDDFVKGYPASKYRPEAQKLLAEANARLAEHEWYAAQFYAKRGYPAGAAGRLETMVKDYPTSPRAGAALFQLAEIYIKMDERFRAQQKLQELIVKHPQDPRRADAEKLLASLR